MKYCVDRIENDIIILENIETNEIIEIKKNTLNIEIIKEGTILVKEDELYKIDDEEKKRREEIIKNKLSKLKGLNNTNN